MSNKNSEKTDGVFEITPAEKSATDAGKPARPPKSKRSLGRETKVGLAVIAALLVIFVIVLVVRLRGGDEDKDVAKSDASTTNKDAKEKTDSAEKKKDAGQQSATMLSPENGKSAGGYWDRDPALPANALRGQSGLGQSPALEGSQGPEAGYDDRVGFSASPGVPAGGQPGSAYPTGSAFPAGGSRESTGSNPFDARPLGTSANPAAAAGFKNNMAPAGAASAIESQLGPLGDTGQTESDVAQPANQELGDQHLADDRGALNPGGGSNGLPPYAQSSGSALGLGAEVQSDPGAAVAGASDDRSLQEAGGGNGFAGSGAGRNNAPGMRIVPDQDANMAERNTPGDSEALTPVERFPAGAVGGPQAPALAQDETEQPAESKLKFGQPPKVAEATPINDAVPPAQQNPPALLENPDAAQGDELYIVKANESYWNIAKRAYGTGAYFKALCEHNRRNGGVAVIEPGVQLRLPDEATLQRLYPTLCPPPSRLAAASPTRTASANVQIDGPAYEVQEGDTLFEIARRQLGKGKRFGEIYALNRDRIGRPTDRLEPGMRLRLPASGE